MPLATTKTFDAVEMSWHLCEKPAANWSPSPWEQRFSLLNAYRRPMMLASKANPSWVVRKDSPGL